MDRQSGGRSMIKHDDAGSPGSRLVGGPVQQMNDAVKSANPLTYVDKNDPPFLIMHGDKDQLVPLGQSIMLAKALIDAGAGHEDMQFRNAESQRLMEEFLCRKLKTGK